MAAFNFPDPTIQQTVTNPITGSTYQWKEPPGKWVITTKVRAVSDIIYEGDTPPTPRGEYKLWYSTDTLELYFWYEDVNGVGAWVPTSAPITMLEDLDAGLAEVKANVVAINQAVNTNENRIETIIAFSETAPPAYPDAITPVVDDEGNPLLDENGEQVVTYTPDPANHKFWVKTSTNELHILRLQDEDLRTYAYELVSASAEIPDLEAVLTAGNVADKDIYLTHIASSDADVIDISPEKAKIIIATEGSKVPTFELQHYAVDDNSQVKLELDEDGTRFDIECDEKVDNIHFRFEDDVKFELNKDGDAVFSGGVDVNGHLDVKEGANTAGNINMKFSSKDGNQQLLTLDSGSSYLPMLHLKSFSSTTTTDGEEQPEVDTVARKDVFIVNATGEAELSGHLTVMPGEEGNQAVTYNQLVEIEEELESLVPSIERGQFDLLLRDIIGGDEGYFNMLEPFTEAMHKAEEAKCKEEYDVCQRNPSADPIDCEADFTRCKTRIPQVGTGYYPTDEFANVIRLKFSYYDVDGTTHNWESLKPGQLIDVFNMEDDSYMLAEVTGTEGMWYAGVDIDVKVLQFKGKATGRCRIKVFELDLNAGSDVDFMRLSGKNKVEDNWKIESESKTHFHVQDNKTKIYWLQDPSSAQHPVTLAYANANYALKTYVDDAIAAATEPAPARYGWKVQLGNTTGEPDDGNVLMQTGSVSTKSNLILSRTPTVGPTLYLRQNRLIFEGKFYNNNNDRINPQVFTVWDRANDQWRWKGTCDIQYMQWDNEGNLRIQCGMQVHWNKVDEGSLLYFNVAGFM